jgi:hypothetical protein
MNSVIEGKLTGRGLSEGSLKLYEANLKRLNNGLDIKNLNFLKDTESIIKQIKEKKDTTARSYIIAICSILKNDLKMQKPYKIYYDLLIEYNDKLKTNNTKSEKQQEEWIGQDEVKSIYDKLEEEVKLLFKKKNLSVDEYNKMLSFVVLSLYVLQPPRRNLDYLKLLAVSKYKGTEDKDFNYFDISKKKMIFNNYKTKGTYQSQEIEVNEKLYLILISWIKKFKIKDYVLQKMDGTELDKNGITKILYKIFDKKIGSSLLRNIYLTDKYSELNKEKIKDANAMGNSVNVIDSNYVKTD